MSSRSRACGASPAGHDTVARGPVPWLGSLFVSHLTLARHHSGSFVAWALIRCGCNRIRVPKELGEDLRHAICRSRW